jgi:GT2 family glycosyltransferase
MMIRSDVFTTIGFLDPSFFMFVEDLDFCWRARLAGFEILAVPEAVVYHKSGGTAQGGAVKYESHITSTLRLYHCQTNTMKTVLKNYGSWALTFILPISVLSGLMTFVVGATILRQAEVTKSYLRALLSNMRDMPLTLTSRLLTQKLRRIPDREILTRMSKKSSVVRSYLEISRLVVRKTP